MNGSPASSTPTATRGASRSETPDILRDSSLLQSDESVITEQQHQQHSESESKLDSREEEMADKIYVDESVRGRADKVTEEEGKREEAQILRDLSEERIRMLENRRRGEVQSKMDETPVGVEMEVLKTPQIQKANIRRKK